MGKFPDPSPSLWQPQGEKLREKSRKSLRRSAGRQNGRRGGDRGGPDRRGGRRLAAAQGIGQDIIQALRRIDHREGQLLLARANLAIAAGRLLRLMPYADSIKSHIEATTAAFSYVLQRKIAIEAMLLPDTYLLQQQNLNEQYLGVNAAIGNTTGEWVACWKCSISGIPDEDLIMYVDGGALKKITDRFIEIFVPVDVDVLFDFRQEVDIQKETYENILGVGAYL